MTISVRLTEKVENALREEATKNRLSISDIVNNALEKYHNEYKYFHPINASAESELHKQLSITFTSSKFT